MDFITAINVGAGIGMLILLVLPYYLMRVYHKRKLEMMVVNTQKLLKKMESMEAMIEKQNKQRRKLKWKKTMQKD